MTALSIPESISAALVSQGLDPDFWIRTQSDVSAIEQGCTIDVSRGEKVCRFAERYVLASKGDYAGQPFELLEWERDVLMRAFSWVRDGRRRFRRVHVWISKKNGKSTLMGLIATYMTCADGEARANVFLAATDRQQAKIAWGEAAAIVQSSPELVKRMDVIRSTSTITHPHTGSRCVAISADHHRQEGLDASFVGMDEMHVWNGERGRRLFGALRWAGAARSQPMEFVCSTAGIYDTEDIGHQQYDYACKVRDNAIIDIEFLPIIYEVPRDADWTDDSTWHLANPAMGTLFTIDQLRNAYAEVRGSVTQTNDFRRYRLNQWVGVEKAWLDMTAWRNGTATFTPEDYRHHRCYAGLDLSTRLDMSAFVLLYAPPMDEWTTGDWFVRPFLFLPESGIADRSRTDNAPYQDWADAGYLHLTPGDTIDYDYIETMILRAAKDHDEFRCGYDPFNAHQLVTRLGERGVDMVEVAQSYRSLSDPSKELESLIVSGRFRHGGHPILTHQAGHVAIRRGPSDNYMPDKTKSRCRIDGITATIVAMAIALADKPPLGPPDDWEPVVLEGRM